MAQGDSTVVADHGTRALLAFDLGRYFVRLGCSPSRWGPQSFGRYYSSDVVGFGLGPLLLAVWLRSTPGPGGRLYRRGD